MLKQALLLLLMVNVLNAVVVPFNQALLSSTPRLVLKFYKHGCPPCQRLAPFYQQLSETDEFKDRVLFMEIDIEQHPQLARTYGIRSVPTILYFKNGQKVYTGVAGKSDIAQEIRTYLL